MSTPDNVRTNLLPCPFCGGDVDPAGWLGGDGTRGPECEGCGSTAPSMDVWNTRPLDESALYNALKELERLKAVASTPPEASPSSVYEMCSYLRSSEDKDCIACPPKVGCGPYGNGVKGCYAIALETLQVAQRTLAPAFQYAPAAPKLTADSICEKCGQRIGAHSAEPGNFFACPVTAAPSEAGTAEENELRWHLRQITDKCKPPLDGEKAEDAASFAYHVACAALFPKLVLTKASQSAAVDKDGERFQWLASNPLHMGYFLAWYTNGNEYREIEAWREKIDWMMSLQASTKGSVKP